MRYCTSRRRVTRSPYRPTSRSSRLTPKPWRAASRDRTVGGSWQWSPARTTRSQRSSGGPAARLRGLARLVDDEQVEAPAAEHFGVQSRGRRAQDRRRVEDAFDGLVLQAAGVGEEGAGLLAHVAAGAGFRFGARPLGGLAEQGERLLQRTCGPGACRDGRPPSGRACVRAAAAGRGRGVPGEPRVRRGPAAVRGGCPRRGCWGRRRAPCRRGARPGGSVPPASWSCPSPAGRGPRPRRTPTGRSARPRAATRSASHREG